MATSGNDPLLRSDEELQEALLVPVTPHNAPVTLAEYDPGWPELFTREASRIRAVLGEDAALVEHAGSASVPGLAAKPIIDIVLAVPDSADEPVYVPAMTAAGYMLRAREPDWFEHRMFKGPDTDINLHVFSAGASEIDRMLLFRDWLRASDADRDACLKVKRELAQRTWRHIQHYADADGHHPADHGTRRCRSQATGRLTRRDVSARQARALLRWLIGGQVKPTIEYSGGTGAVPLGHQHVNDLAVLVSRPGSDSRMAGGLDVCLAGEPPVSGNVTAQPGSLDELRSELLDVHGDVVHGDTALGQQLPGIPVGQAMAQAPADRD